jgi:hypothetical protein
VFERYSVYASLNVTIVQRDIPNSAHVCKWIVEFYLISYGHALSNVVGKIYNYYMYVLFKIACVSIKFITLM